MAPFAHNPDRSPLLAFIHVPKTAGTSFLGALQRGGHSYFIINSPDKAREFINLSHADQDIYKCVIGHMPFGIDVHIERSVNYAVFLRHPVERVLSAYDHNLRRPEEPGAETIRRMGIAWAKRPANFMCRFLAYYDLLEAPDHSGAFWHAKNAPDFAPRDYLDQAKEHLEKCAFLGLQENFEKDILAIPYIQGQSLNIEGVPRLNTGEGRLRREDLHPHVVESIIAANNLDIELYQFAMELRAARGGPLKDRSMNALVNSGEPVLLDQLG